MIDHLEPYRRMVRTMRFVPPLGKNQPSHHPLTQPIAPTPDNSWSSVKGNGSEVTSASQPTPDPSEHIAALVREAVWKPTVIPANYLIEENIGDRISRLAIPKKIIPIIVPSVFPQPEDYPISSYTVEVQHTQSPSSEPIETSDAQAVVSAPSQIEEEHPEVTSQVSAKTLDTEPEQLEKINTTSTEEEASKATISDEDTLIEQPQNQLEVGTKSENVPENISTLIEPEEVIAETIATPIVEPEAFTETTSEPKISPAIEPDIAVESTPAEQTQVIETPEIICPKCQSTQTRKNGHYKGKQRYACKECGKQFVMPDPVENKQEETTEAIATSATITEVPESNIGKKGFTNTAKSSRRPLKSKKKGKGASSKKGK